MSKSRDAFRTISEVSDALDTPAHVLRFWESKFAQVKPVKRAGGRRYYRPGDVNLLAGIKKLLHDDGMTIKGAQKLIREKGVKYTIALGATALDARETDAIDTAPDQAPEVKSISTETSTKVDVVPKPVPELIASPQTELDLGIIDVIPLSPSGPKGPALTLDLTAKSAPTEGQTTAKLAPPDVPADPSDADNKAPARMFHLLHKVRPEKLATRAAEIGPLLERMQILRDRIDIR